MDLPKLSGRPTSPDLSIAFAHAAGTLLTEGRKAVSVGVLGAGGRMMTTAKLLAKCSQAFAKRRRPKGLFRDAWYSLILLKEILHFEKQTLRSYCECLFPVHSDVRKRLALTGRPFVVREVVETMMWSGTIWAVGCNTWESAERAFRNRVKRNLADQGETGAVVAFDRRRDLLICWTPQIKPANWR